jgi:hypothetical protein
MGTGLKTCPHPADNLQVMKILRFLLLSALFAGCASMGFQAIEPPPEFKQKVLLEVGKGFSQHQAPRSGYDVGDLQNFHTQHTLPMVVEDSFKEVFPLAEMVESSEGVGMDEPDVPAIFEVRMIDVANDIYNEADSYRAEVTMAVAMKSPDGHIFWQKAFRGEGYVQVDPQFSTGLGPQDAVVDAVRDALGQMQDALLSEPQVRIHMQKYQAIEDARQQQEVGV